MFDGLEMFQFSSASGYQVDYGVFKVSAPGKQKAFPLDLENSTPKINWIDHLRRIQANKDQQAFAELFSYFAPRVKAFLIKSGANPGLAEECTQEVMATLWHKAHLFDPSRAGVSTWIFTIARNKKIDALRKQRRPEPEDLAWGPEAEPEAADVLALQQETKNLET